MDGLLENSDVRKPYLEFFGLTQPPFAKLARPSELFHTDQNALLMAHLVNAIEQPDCLVVIGGAEGSGKTALLNNFICSLSDQSSFAIIDETCTGEGELYSAFLRQIGFSEITGTPKELRNITRQFLVNRGVAGDSVLIAIDNAERISPVVLEQLRWISAITVNDRPVLSVVLAGNSQLVHVVNSPAMTQIKFANQVYFNVRRYTEDETSKYIRQRLRWAGAGDGIRFSDEAYPLVFRYSGGIARKINMICNDALFGACAEKSHVITASLIRKVADRRRLLPHIAPLHGKGRRKTDRDFVHARPSLKTELQADEVGPGRDVATPDDAPSHDAEPNRRLQSVPDSSNLADDDEDLREQVSILREQVSDLTQDKLRALHDVSMRNEDITELRSRLRAKTLETEKLTDALKNNFEEIQRQKQALAASTDALQVSEGAANQLAADLESERANKKSAEADFAKAEARAEELSQLRIKLDAQTAKTEEQARALEDNAAEIERQNSALTDSRKAVQESEQASKKLAADLEREKLVARSAQADIEKAKAKTEELGQLREKLDAQTAEIERLNNELDSNSFEFRQQNQALAASTKALHESEEATRKLAADLERERLASITAEADFAKAEARAEELAQLRDSLDKQTAKTEELASALEDNADEIGRQNRALAESQKAMQESEQATRKLAADLEKEKVAAKTAQSGIARAKEKAEELSQHKAELQFAIGKLSTDLKKAEDRVVAVDAVVERLIESVPACQTLERYDRATYNSLITTCEMMFKQKYDEQQIADALRVQQAELIERQLPKASDKAVMNYARLIVDQLREYRIHGAELCFGKWVPQFSGGHEGLPAISQRTREREYALLELTLRTYDPEMDVPMQETVWPDIWPIFQALFEAYGESTVESHFDDSAPNADKEMMSNISMSLYLRLLDLRKKKAVKALRWILSP